LTLINTNNNGVRDVALCDLLAETRGSPRHDKNWKLFQPDYVCFKAQKDPPIDPYFLGLWFGDGSKDLKGVCISKPDKEVLDCCEQTAKKWGLRVTVVDGVTCPTYRLSRIMGSDDGGINPLTVALRALVGPNTEVPQSYLTMGRADRRAFLAGWLDADGHLTSNCYEIAQKRRDYIDAVGFLARSVGLRATMQPKIVDGTTYWRMMISGRVDQLPLRIPRKQASPRQQIKNALRTGFDVEAIGVGDYFGFELDGDGRFLLGDFTVTHNTTLLRLLVLVFAKHHGIPIWTAMTGKAATRMNQAAGLKASTLHAKLYEPPASSNSKGKTSLTFSALREPDGTHLVIDEGSMITPQIVRDLGEWRRQGVRVLFVGDSFQLPPVISKEEEREINGKDYSVFDLVPGPSLTEVMRNGDAILDAATALRVKGNLPLGKRGGYELIRCPDPSGMAVAHYLADPTDHGLITWTNKTRMGANFAIRKKLGITSPELEPGEPILVCKNALGGVVLNGEVYIIKEISPSITLGNLPGIPTWTIITVCGRYIHALGHSFDGSTPYFADYGDWKAYKKDIDQRRIPEPIPITYGHVLTAHKAQGSEYRRVTVFLPKRDTSIPHFQAKTSIPGGGTAPFARRWLYTALTRAKTQLSILMGT
jgi:hypothetical protein